jgi:hypothetical protein
VEGVQGCVWGVGECVKTRVVSVALAARDQRASHSRIISRHMADKLASGITIYLSNIYNTIFLYYCTVRNARE